MKLRREIIKKEIIDLYIDDGEIPPNVDTMSDDELLGEYCMSGLFGDKYPRNYEEEIEGLE